MSHRTGATARWVRAKGAARRRRGGSAAPGLLDRGDVDLLHGHHRVEGALRGGAVRILSSPR
jgi:hypothetical protein